MSLNIISFLQTSLNFHITESEEIFSDAASQIILKEEWHFIIISKFKAEGINYSFQEIL